MERHFQRRSEGKWDPHPAKYLVALEESKFNNEKQITVNTKSQWDE